MHLVPPAENTMPSAPRLLRLALRPFGALFSAAGRLATARIQVLPTLALLGAANLIFFAGALVMYCDIPPAAFLKKAFWGTKVWWEQLTTAPEQPPNTDVSTGSKLVVYNPEKVSPGYTLYTTEGLQRALLIDMNGTVVHQWTAPRKGEHWFRAYLFPTGELLAVPHANPNPGAYGGALVKLDRDSKLIWKYAGFAHHDLDVDEEGTIYVLTQQLESKLPAGFEEELSGGQPYRLDYLTLLAPDGRETAKISLLEAFRDSPYAFLLGRESSPDGRTALEDGDVLHANAVKVLKRNLAASFPQFKVGQVLVSLRNMDVIAVIDPKMRVVVWATRGPWAKQHDPEFLPDGRLLIYDNAGSSRKLFGTPELKPDLLLPPGETGRSRIVEFDPRTLGVTWSYDGDGKSPFFNSIRGMKQHLPNGNVLISNPAGVCMLEVTREKETVWEFHPADCGPMMNPLTGVRRYSADELPFLKETGRDAP
jgi:Arylsulfotransferase (ASST)